MPVSSNGAVRNSYERAGEMCCRGEFSAAIAALGDDWPGLGVRPRRDGLADRDYAALLMVCAVISINVGAMSLRPAQNAAKDMLSESARLSGDGPEADAAKLWLGVAYLRCGENHEAIAYCQGLLRNGAPAGVVFSAGLTVAIAEMQLGDPGKSLNQLDQITVLLPQVPALVQGKYYLSRGMALRAQGRFDDALLAYDRAADLFQEAGCPRYEAAVSNNVARVYSERGQFLRAHASAERAASIYQRLQDKAHEAKAWDEIARIYIREENFNQAVRASRRAVSLLSESDHEGWLAEALTTHGIALARAGLGDSIQSLKQAAEIAERMGNRFQADEAYSEMWNTLKEGRAIVELLLPIERLLISHALERHGGSLSLAAKSLGMRHSSLDWRIKTYFPDLMAKRKTPVKRRKSIIKPRSG